MKKELIQDVQNYFTQKLIAGEYEIDMVTEYHTIILIDGYQFVFWTARGEKNFKQYADIEYPNFLILDLSTEDLKAIWETLSPKFEKISNDELRSQKLKQFNKLKAELGLN